MNSVDCFKAFLNILFFANLHVFMQLCVMRNVMLDWKLTNLMYLSRSTESWRLSPTRASTRSPTGSWTDRRTSRTASTPRLHPTVSTTSSVRILSAWRESVRTEAWDTTGGAFRFFYSPFLLNIHNAYSKQIQFYFYFQCPRERSAHQDYWQTRSHCRCVQEEGEVRPWIAPVIELIFW